MCRWLPECCNGEKLGINETKTWIGIRRAEFRSQLCPLLAVWSWASHLISLSCNLKRGNLVY